MKILLSEVNGSSGLVPFTASKGACGIRTYCTPCDTNIYARFKNSVTTGHVVVVDFYSYRETLAKSVTQSSTFVDISFANIRQKSETWHNIGIAPTSKKISPSLPDEIRSKLRMKLFQIFIFIIFCNLITTSYTGFALSGEMFVPCISIGIADQRDERTFSGLVLYSMLYSSHCTVPSRVGNENPSLLSS